MSTMSVTQYTYCHLVRPLHHVHQNEPYECYDRNQAHRSIQKDGQKHDTRNGPRSISYLLGHVSDTIDTEKRRRRRDGTNDASGTRRRPATEIGELCKYIDCTILRHESVFVAVGIALTAMKPSTKRNRIMDAVKGSILVKNMLTMVADTATAMVSKV
jgi:hypothetical protein